VKIYVIEELWTDYLENDFRAGNGWPVAKGQKIPKLRATSLPIIKVDPNGS
jgi:hypothetical protein